jgi:hypothetical protein
MQRGISGRSGDISVTNESERCRLGGDANTVNKVSFPLYGKSSALPRQTASCTNFALASLFAHRYPLINAKDH